MTNDRISAIRERCEAATKWPWKSLLSVGGKHYITTPSYGVRDFCCLTGGLERGADADFIAHSREDIPFLLAEIDRLTEAQRWIPVTESIPPYGEEVLVMHSGVVDIAVMDEVNVFTNLFTHWKPLPLPAAPKGE